MTKKAIALTASSMGNALPDRIKKRIEEVMHNLRLGDAARKYVSHRIETGPSRPVQGRQGNRVYNIKSRKMEMRHELESYSGEYVLSTLLEWDDTVIAYFPQAPQVQLNIRREDGSRANVTPYTPDMLVVRANEIVILETRDDDKLFQRSIKNPHQFYFDAHGTWHYRAAEEHFAEIGFRYELLANSKLPKQQVENLKFLEDYIAEDAQESHDLVTKAVAQAMAERGQASRRELQDLGFTTDDVFRTLAYRLIYVDLERTRLSHSQDLVFFVDKITCQTAQLINASANEPALPIPGTFILKPGSQVRFGGKTYTVILCGERDVKLRTPSGDLYTHPMEGLLEARRAGQIEIDGYLPESRSKSIADCSNEQIAKAHLKLEAVKAGKSDRYSERSISRFKSQIEGCATELSQLLALVDNDHARGNRNSRITTLNQELIRKAIKFHFNDERGSTATSAWRKYLGMCQETEEPSGGHVNPVAYPTFSQYCSNQASIFDRKGKRAAYQKAPILQSVDSAFPVHGARPHEVCYVDHTVANIGLISPHGYELGKPTLTLAVDGHTAQPRAMYLSFDPPSTKVALMVLRDYVRRNKRLPDCLSVDNGKEFHSKELVLFCKYYGIDLRYRSPGMPRGGTMIERLLGATEEEVLSELKGNTRILKTDTRLVTKSVNPFNHLEWTLKALYGALESHLFNERANRVHPALCGLTPNQQEAKSLMETGHRTFKGVDFDESIMLLTSPHPKYRYHKVDAQRGVWVNGMTYQHPELRKLPKGAKVEIRIEPWNASVVYVYANKRWHAAIGNNSRWQAGRTSREVEIALRAEAKKSNSAATQDRMSPTARRTRQTVLRPEHFDQRLSAQQLEMKFIYAPLGMTEALPNDTPIPAVVQIVDPHGTQHLEDTQPAKRLTDMPPAQQDVVPAQKPSPAQPKEHHARRITPEIKHEAVEVQQDGSVRVLKPAPIPAHASVLGGTGRFV